MDYIFITGVSSGIGYDLTRFLLQKDIFVIGSVRKKSDADRLKNEFPRNFATVFLDVTREADFAPALDAVQKITQNKGLTAIVNNAGIAIAGPLQHLKIDSLRLQLEVNVIGLVRTTQVFFPLLLAANKPGRIINISSVSGRVALPFVGAYAASKHAVEAISDALRREVFIHGIKVINIQPASAHSEIWNKAIDQKDEYVNTEYKPILQKMEENIQQTIRNAIPTRMVSEAIWKAISHPSPKTRYIVAPSKWKFKLFNLLPDKWLDFLITKNIKKYWKK